MCHTAQRKHKSQLLSGYPGCHQNHCQATHHPEKTHIPHCPIHCSEKICIITVGWEPWVSPETPLCHIAWRQYKSQLLSGYPRYHHNTDTHAHTHANTHTYPCGTHTHSHTHTHTLTHTLQKSTDGSSLRCLRSRSYCLRWLKSATFLVVLDRCGTFCLASFFSSFF